MKCTELVIKDHSVLRRGLDILDGMMKTMEDGNRIEVADAKAILKFLQLFGDEYHQTIEEKVLFPALVRAAPQGSPVHQLVLAHGEERALMAWIVDALNSRRVIDFVYSSRRFSALLRTHLDKEDALLSDLAERLLSKEEDSMVVAEFMNSRREPESLVNFSRMEGKYTTKSNGKLLSPQPEMVRGRAASYTAF